MGDGVSSSEKDCLLRALLNRKPELDDSTTSTGPGPQSSEEGQHEVSTEQHEVNTESSCSSAEPRTDASNGDDSPNVDQPEFQSETGEENTNSTATSQTHTLTSSEEDSSNEGESKAQLETADESGHSSKSENVEISSTTVIEQTASSSEEDGDQTQSQLSTAAQSTHLPKPETTETRTDGSIESHTQSSSEDSSSNEEPTKAKSAAEVEVRKESDTSSSAAVSSESSAGTNSSKDEATKAQSETTVETRHFPLSENVDEAEPSSRNHADSSLAIPGTSGVHSGGFLASCSEQSTSRCTNIPKKITQRRSQTEFETGTNGKNTESLDEGISSGSDSNVVAEGHGSFSSMREVQQPHRSLNVITLRRLSNGEKQESGSGSPEELNPPGVFPEGPIRVDPEGMGSGESTPGQAIEQSSSGSCTPTPSIPSPLAPPPPIEDANMEMLSVPLDNSDLKRRRDSPTEAEQPGAGPSVVLPKRAKIDEPEKEQDGAEATTERETNEGKETPMDASCESSLISYEESTSSPKTSTSISPELIIVSSDDTSKSS